MNPATALQPEQVLPVLRPLSTEPADMRPSEDIIDQLRGRLGHGVVMIPVPSGQKAPTRKGWQKTALERMLDEQYLNELRAGNIGVLLGKPSGNVCSIDIDDDAAVEPFLELNPRLRTTLRTKGYRGCQIWVRITDEELPKSCKLTTQSGHPFGEWRADGNQSIIHGRHEKGVDYQRVVDAPVVEIAFDDIVWPDDLKTEWGDRAFRDLVAEVGEPVVGNAINVSFFSRVFAMRKLVGVRRGKICIYNPTTGMWCSQQPEEIKKSVWLFVREFLRELGLTKLLALLKQRIIDEIIGLLFTEGQPVPEPQSSRFMHVKNGMIDLLEEPPRLLPFSPEYGSLQRVEIDYDPEQASCPLFTEWLEVSMNYHDRLLFQEWTGALLIGPNYAHRIMLLSGDAGSGKTSLVSLVEKLVGSAACQQLRPSQLDSRFETREYVNKRLLMGNDVPADFLTGKNTAILKSLTGGDTMTAELKMENAGVTFKGDFHVVIGSNEELALRVEGDADAWERRLLSIHMFKPETRSNIPDFANRLFRDEGEGILAWAVDGARLHLANDYQYHLSDDQEQRIQRILNASDGVRLFVEQRLRLDETARNNVTMDQLYEAYESFAKEYDCERFKKPILGRKLVPLIQSRFGLRQRHDIVSGMPGGNVKRGYKGLIILGP